MTTRNIPIEREFKNLYVNENEARGGQPVTSTIQVHRPDHPFRNVAGKPPTPQHCEIEIPGRFRIQIQSSGKGIHVRHAACGLCRISTRHCGHCPCCLPTHVPVIYTGGPRQDDRYTESPEPPTYVNTSYRVSSPSNEYRVSSPSATYTISSPGNDYYEAKRSYSPGGFTQTFVSSPPAQSAVNQTAPLPRSTGISVTYDRPKSREEYDRPKSREEARNDPRFRVNSPYYEDSTYQISSPTTSNVTYSIQRNDGRPVFQPDTGRSSPSYNRQSQQPQPQHYPTSSAMTPTSPTKTPTSVRSPTSLPGEGVRSQLLYTAPAPQQGVVQSRPTGGSTSNKPSSGLAGTHSPTLSYSAPARDSNAKTGEAGDEGEVDALTNLLMQNMDAASDPEFFGPCSYCGRVVKGPYNVCKAFDKVYHIQCFRCFHCGMCGRCGRAILGENTGCSALDQLYHLHCFTCLGCGECLGGQPFFAMEGKPYCESCYLNTLEKCSVCSKPITDRILRATGKPYHPACFMCVVCGKSLDGIPFTVDATNQIHCIQDFHKKFAPRCCVCNEPIMPDQGQEETVRIVAMDRSFHVNCYKCEDCGVVLSSEAEGRGCYPLDEHILCKNCNAKRIQAISSNMTTEL